MKIAVPMFSTRFPKKKALYLPKRDVEKDIPTVECPAEAFRPRLGLKKLTGRPAVDLQTCTELSELLVEPSRFGILAAAATLPYARPESAAPKGKIRLFRSQSGWQSRPVCAPTATFLPLSGRDLRHP